MTNLEKLGERQIVLDCNGPKGRRERLGIPQHGRIAAVLRAGQVHRFAGLWVLGWPLPNVVDDARLEFLPAFLAQVDHPSIQAQPFGHVMILPRIAQHQAFRGEPGTLALGFSPQALALGLAFSPEIRLGNTPMTNPLKHFYPLPIR